MPLESIPDAATVSADGERLATVPHGVIFRDMTTHVDERGELCELFDPRWGWTEEDLVYAYMATIRPGWTKGWAIHREHMDRYCLLFGSVEVVLYDTREDSPTTGLLFTVVLTDRRRRLMTIPIGVWHADRNIGQTEAVSVNYPTRPYEHGRPDKGRLPLDHPDMPDVLRGERGW